MAVRPALAAGQLGRTVGLPRPAPMEPPPDRSRRSWREPTASSGCRLTDEPTAAGRRRSDTDRVVPNDTPVQLLIGGSVHRRRRPLSFDARRRHDEGGGGGGGGGGEVLLQWPAAGGGGGGVLRWRVSCSDVALMTAAAPSQLTTEPLTPPTTGGTHTVTLGHGTAPRAARLLFVSAATQPDPSGIVPRGARHTGSEARRNAFATSHAHKHSYYSS